MSGNNKKQWKVISTTDLFKTPFFRMRTDSLLLPNNKTMPHYYTFDYKDWVNIVPITKAGEVVLIRQYRHSVGDEMIEIPGGSIEGEPALDAGVRELAEETGYVPETVELLGWQHPNPALQSNKLWSFIALGCEKKLEQNLDEFEDIEVFTASKKEVLDLVMEGKIQHSLVISSLFLALKYLK